MVPDNASWPTVRNENCIKTHQHRDDPFEFVVFVHFRNEMKSATIQSIKYAASSHWATVPHSLCSNCHFSWFKLHLGFLFFHPDQRDRTQHEDMSEFTTKMLTAHCALKSIPTSRPDGATVRPACFYWFQFKSSEFTANFQELPHGRMI